MKKIIEVPYFNLIPWYLKNLNKYTKDYRIIIYDSFKNYKANGGRNHTIDTKTLLLNLKKIKKFEIGFTLTNPDFSQIEPELNDLIKDLKHVSNFIKISFIISNDKLAAIMKNEFPNIEIIKSITSLPFPFYNQIDKLLTIYDYIVPRNEIVYNNYNIEKYRPYFSKFISLFSFECSFCPIYQKHYGLIAKYKDGRYQKCIVKRKDKEEVLKKLLNDNYINNKEFDETMSYEYKDSKIFYDNYLKVMNEFGGYKIGRNNTDDVLSDVDNLFKLIS